MTQLCVAPIKRHLDNIEHQLRRTVAGIYEKDFNITLQFKYLSITSFPYHIFVVAGKNYKNQL